MKLERFRAGRTASDAGLSKALGYVEKPDKQVQEVDAQAIRHNVETLDQEDPGGPMRLGTQGQYVQILC